MGDRIADLILARGNAQARGLSARGAIWGDTLSNLGQIGAGVAGQVAEGLEVNRAEQAAARESQALRQLFSAGSPTPEQLIGVVGPERGIRIATGLQALRPTTDPVKDYTARQTILRDTILGMHALPEDMRAEQWPHARQNLIDRKLLSEQDAPATYDKAFFDRLTNYGKEPEKPAKVGTREIDVRNPDGSVTKQIVADTPGQSFTSAAPAPTPAKAGSEEDFIARFAKDLGKPVEALTAPQVAAARRQYARQTRFTEGGAGGAQTERITKAGQIMDVPKGEANRYFAEGWKPFDAVSARQQSPIADGEAADTAAEIMRVASALRNHKGLGQAFGILDSKVMTLNQETADAEVLRDSLTSLMTLENTGKLKGVLSNSDMELLRRASSTIAPQMGDAAAAAELDRIIAVMQKALGATKAPSGTPRGDASRRGVLPPTGAGVVVQTPQGPFTFPDQAAADAFKREAGIR